MEVPERVAEVGSSFTITMGIPKLHAIPGLEKDAPGNLGTVAAAAGAESILHDCLSYSQMTNIYHHITNSHRTVLHLGQFSQKRITFINLLPTSIRDEQTPMNFSDLPVGRFSFKALIKLVVR